MECKLPLLCMFEIGRARQKSPDVNSFTTARLVMGGACIRRVEEFPTKTSFSSVPKILSVPTRCRQNRLIYLKFKIFSNFKSGTVFYYVRSVYCENLVKIRAR